MQSFRKSSLKGSIDMHQVRRRTIHRLTDEIIPSLTRQGRYADGGCLYLSINANGRKRWVFLYTFRKRQREMGLGSAGVVTLAKAREQAAQARFLISQGSDPLNIKCDAKDDPNWLFTSRQTTLVVQECRQNLADRLRSGRRRLKILQQRIAVAELTLATKRSDDFVLTGSLYPAAPVPEITPHEDGFGLPEVSGIYFLWAEDGTLDYVGQSIKLNQRLRLGNHHILRGDHKISFLIFDQQNLTWAECYYIGILKPRLNFGMRRLNWDERHNHGHA